MICFHHNDADGRCAAAIVYSKYNDCRFYEMKYSKEIPFDLINKNEAVFIVDFSFHANKMAILGQITKNIVWIDHHKTILDHPWNTSSIKRIRDTRASGALLTWEYLYQKKPIPLAVKLISDYDTWSLKMPNSKEFRFGLNLEDHQPDDIIWKSLLSRRKETVRKIIKNGKICLKLIKNMGQDYCKSYGFETVFEGYRCFAQGVYMFGSTFFGDKINKYDICISYEYTGDNWIISLYSTKIDVSKIAKKMGGGGHTGAAGFISKNLPFVKS